MWFSHLTGSLRSVITHKFSRLFLFFILILVLILPWVWICIWILFANKQVKESICNSNKNEENKAIHYNLCSSWSSWTERIEPTDRVSRLSKALAIIINVWQCALTATSLTLANWASRNGLTAKLTISIIVQYLESISVVAIIASCAWYVAA